LISSKNSAYQAWSWNLLKRSCVSLKYNITTKIFVPWPTFYGPASTTFTSTPPPTQPPFTCLLVWQTFFYLFNTNETCLILS
jgi:hypothetical protein